MRIYLFKRILYIIPTLLFVILLSFVLLHYSPGDPVERILAGQVTDNESLPTPSNIRLKDEIRTKLGLKLPLFYFSMSDMWERKSLSNISPAEWEKYIPVINFYSQNQFQRWLLGDGNNSKGIIRGDFGESWITHQDVSAIIRSRIGWSLFFTIIPVFLAYLISIPVGLKTAANPGSRFDNFTKILFNVFYSLPAFWVATLLMLTFCNPDMFNILPPSGVGPIGGFNDTDSFIHKIIHTIPYMVLPTICFTYSSFAFLSGSIKLSVTEVLREDYIRTARAKGVDEKIIIKKHAFRNALLPMITIFSHVFPYAIGGSVILETIFDIPGMGLAIYQSINSQDYPVIISIFMITGLITMLGFLLTDILYAFADPRISYHSKKIKA